MASIRPCPKSPSKLEIRFTCVVTKTKRTIAVGCGDMQLAERLKAKIQDVILKVRNGDKKKPSAHLIKKKNGLKDWYISGGSVGGLDLRSEWLEDIESTIAFSTLEGYRHHIESFDLADPKLTLKDIQSRFTVRTAKKYKATFKTYWTWLIDNDYTQSPNPLRGFKFDKAEAKEERWSYKDLSRFLKKEKGLNPGDPQWDDVMLRRVYLSDGEFELAKEWVKGYLLKNDYGRKFALACLLASEAGLRRGDIVRLRKQDLEGRIILIRRTKGSASNHYKTSRSALSPGTADELQRFMDESGREYPFARSAMPVDGTAEFQKAVRKEAYHLSALLNSRKKAFPFPGALYGYHVLRHSVSAKAKQNLTKEQTKALLGHETDTMYHHYGGTDAKELIAAVDAIT